MYNSQITACMQDIISLIFIPVKWNYPSLIDVWSLSVIPPNRKRINWGLIKLKERFNPSKVRKKFAKNFTYQEEIHFLCRLCSEVLVLARLDLFSACNWSLYSKRVISNKPIYNYFATFLLTFEKQIRKKSALKLFEAKKVKWNNYVPTQEGGF